MGLEQLQTNLSGTQSIGIDTAPLIYFVEGNPEYKILVDFIFRKISSGDFHAFTSTITLIETLIAPLEQGDHSLAAQYQQFRND